MQTSASKEPLTAPSCNALCDIQPTRLIFDEEPEHLSTSSWDVFSTPSCQLVFYKEQTVVPITPDVKWYGLCKSIADNNPEYIASAILSDANLNTIVTRKVIESVDNECKSLCAVTLSKSILRNTDTESLLKCKFNDFVEGEIKHKAPTLYQLMMTLVNPKGSERNTEKTIER